MWSRRGCVCFSFQNDNVKRSLLLLEQVITNPVPPPSPRSRIWCHPCRFSSHPLLVLLVPFYLQVLSTDRTVHQREKPVVPRATWCEPGSHSLHFWRRNDHWSGTMFLVEVGEVFGPKAKCRTVYGPDRPCPLLPGTGLSHSITDLRLRVWVGDSTKGWKKEISSELR